MNESERLYTKSELVLEAMRLKSAHAESVSEMYQVGLVVSCLLLLGCFLLAMFLLYLRTRLDARTLRYAMFAVSGGGAKLTPKADPDDEDAGEGT